MFCYRKPLPHHQRFAKHVLKSYEEPSPYSGLYFWDFITNEVMLRARSFKLKWQDVSRFNKSSTEFFTSQIKYLGQIISTNRKRQYPFRIEAIKSMVTPENMTTLQTFFRAHKLLRQEVSRFNQTCTEFFKGFSCRQVEIKCITLSYSEKSYNNTQIYCHISIFIGQPKKYSILQGLAWFVFRAYHPPIVGHSMPNPLYTYILNKYELVWLAFMAYQP